MQTEDFRKKHRFLVVMVALKMSLGALYRN